MEEQFLPQTDLIYVIDKLESNVVRNAFKINKDGQLLEEEQKIVDNFKKITIKIITMQELLT